MVKAVDNEERREMFLLIIFTIPPISFVIAVIALSCGIVYLFTKTPEILFPDKNE